MSSVRTATLLVMAVMFAGVTAAQPSDTVDLPANVTVNPGVIGPGNPLYGLEVAFDNAMVKAGLSDAAAVARERASEVAVAQRQGFDRGIQQATAALSSVAATARSTNATGLKHARSILQTVKQQAPSQAQTGLDTALSQLDDAIDRVPTPGGPGKNDQTDRGGTDTDTGPGDSAGGSGPGNSPGNGPSPGASDQ